MEKISISELKLVIGKAQERDLNNQQQKKVDEIEFALKNTNIQYLRITKMFNVIKNIVGEMK